MEKEVIPVVEKEKIKLPKGYSITDLERIKDDEFPFDGRWFEAFSRPATRGVWLIWGNSGNGKTRFTLQLVKELGKYKKIAYDSLEEGTAKTIRNAIENIDLKDIKRNFLLLDCEPVEVLSERLSRRKSPDIVIIDSFQYSQLDYKGYIQLKEKHRDKLIIFTSHAEGKKPAGRTAERVRYDAALKIWVEGYRAESQGRYKGTRRYYTIWEEGSINYWGA